MRCVVQRVSRASVTVEGKITGQVEKGYMVLVGVEQGDDEQDVRYCADKVAGLRVFEDENGKMNRSVKDVGGAVLAVSQFTLLGDARHGRRPSFPTPRGRRRPTRSTRLSVRRFAPKTSAWKRAFSRRICRWSLSTTGL